MGRLVALLAMLCLWLVMASAAEARCNEEGLRSQKSTKAATVQFITDAGHTWPGTSIREGDKSPPADLAASELIWDFFKAHPKR